MRGVLVCAAGRAGHDVALCNGHIYLIAGFTRSISNKKHPADVWMLAQEAVTATASAAGNVQSLALPKLAGPEHLPDRCFPLLTCPFAKSRDLHGCHSQLKQALDAWGAVLRRPCIMLSIAPCVNIFRTAL